MCELQAFCFSPSVAHFALKPKPTPPEDPPDGGQTVTLMHSGDDPRPPFWLLVTQMVSFSSLACEFSAADDSSENSRVSITLMAPEITNVLFLLAAAIEA